MKKIILVMALMASTLVMGAELKKHMIITETGGSASFSRDTYEGNYELDIIDIGAGYYYAFNKYFQLGVQGSYTIIGGMDDTVYTINPGAKFNLPLNEKDGIMDSLFLGLNVGYMGSVGEVSSVSEFFYTVEAGKHFKLLENLSYSPSISMLHLPGLEDSDPSFSLNFLKLSIHF